MPIIGTLVTGAGIVTTIPGQPQCEEFIMFGDVDTAMPLQGIQVEVGGSTYLNIANAATLIAAYSKWLSQWVGTVVGVVLKIATGNIPLNTTYRFTNAGATTPSIYAWSDNDAGVPFIATPKTVVASSYDDFDKFSALFIQTPANLDRAEVVFTSGRKQTLVGVELDAMLSMKMSTETNGQLGGVTVIDNTDKSISQVRIWTNAGVGGTAVLIAKIPDVAYAAMQGR